MGLNVERVPRGLIAIGASVGGFDALTRLFAKLPRDFPATVTAVIHRSPIFVSDLGRALGRRSQLVVVEASDRDPIVSGRAYVAPPDQHMVIESSLLRLRRSPKVHFTRPAVDPLFESAAAAYGPRVVGVLLTGGGEDGVSGLMAIKAAGGVSIVQHPGEAAHPSMPTSAILYDHVDAILPLDRIAEALITLAAGGVVEETARDRPPASSNSLPHPLD
jgi:two-component system chemotaxis response regulator CheB